MKSKRMGKLTALAGKSPSAPTPSLADPVVSASATLRQTDVERAIQSMHLDSSDTPKIRDKAEEYLRRLQKESLSVTASTITGAIVVDLACRESGLGVNRIDYTKQLGVGEGDYLTAFTEVKRRLGVHLRGPTMKELGCKLGAGSLGKKFTDTLVQFRKIHSQTAGAVVGEGGYTDPALKGAIIYLVALEAGMKNMRKQDVISAAEIGNATSLDTAIKLVCSVLPFEPPEPAKKEPKKKEDKPKPKQGQKREREHVGEEERAARDDAVVQARRAQMQGQGTLDSFVAPSKSA